MKKIGKRLVFAGVILTIIAFAGCELMVTGELDWLNSPYGYVVDDTGEGVEDASVEVYRDSVDSANKVQNTEQTDRDGYFSLDNKVDSEGGTYIVVVTPPSSSNLEYENVQVDVPDDTYLYNIGTIRPATKNVNESTGFDVGGNVINVRELESD